MSSRRDQLAIPALLAALSLSWALVATAPAQEIRVVEQFGSVSADAGSPCPPDMSLCTFDYETDDLSDYEQHAHCWDDSECGGSDATASLLASITSTTITATMAGSILLQDLLASASFSRVLLRFEVTAAVPYTLVFDAASTITGVTGICEVEMALVGVHEIEEEQPDFRHTFTGTLEPGIYTLEARTAAVRIVRGIPGNYEYEDGTTFVSGLVSLEFGAGQVVDTVPTNLGSLKAQYR